MSESEIILRAEHLNSYYEQTAGGNRLFGGKKYKKQILKDVTFEVRRGEILGLVGESGCGKTTLAGSILGFQKHLEGTVTPEAVKELEAIPEIVRLRIIKSAY